MIESLVSVHLYLFLFAILQNGRVCNQQSNGVPSLCLLNRLDRFPCNFRFPETTSVPGFNQFGVYSTRLVMSGESYVCNIRRRNHIIKNISTLHGDERIKLLYSPGRELNPPENYSNQQLVLYNISCPPGHSAYFNITYIDMEKRNCYDESANESLCVDYVSYGCTDPSFGFIEICGNHSPQSIICNGRMTVLFRTSTNGSYPGFQAVVTCFVPDSANLPGCVNPPTNPPKNRGKKYVEPISFSKQEEEVLHELTTAQYPLVTTDSAHSMDGKRRKRQTPESNNMCGGLEESVILVALANENSCNPVLRTSSQVIIEFLMREDPECLERLRKVLANDCGPLANPNNGTVTLVNGTLLGSVAIYTCDLGYGVDGDVTRRCQGNKSWSGQSSCQVDCGGLSSPFNGEVRLTRTLLGSESIYACNTGYEIVGNSTRECLSDGTWSDEEPRCVVKNFVVIVGAVVSAFVILLLIGLMLVLCCTIRYWKKKLLYLKAKSQETIEFNSKSSKQIRSTKDSQICEIIKLIPQSLRIAESHLEMSGYTIGQGSFGIVYKGLLINWNSIPVQEVAVKVLREHFTLNDVERMVNEIIKMKEFNHPHVLPLIGVCLDNGPGVSMVMPYMINGSLLDYLKQERSNLVILDNDPDKVPTVRKLLLRMCHQIALGMEYLTKQKFIHRDLAARNCMLDSDGNIKVGDFGLAEDVYSCGYFREENKENIRLPYKWMALESLNDNIFTEKTDVWSYGVTMWEIFSGGETPYPAVDPMSLVQLLKNGRRLDAPQNTACSPEIFAVMSQCWCENTINRPKFSELSSIMDQSLSLVSDYTELGMVLYEDDEEYDTMKMPNTGRSTSAGDFDNYDTTTAPALNENIAYNAHKKAAISTIDNQVSTRIGKGTAGPTYMAEYDDIRTTLSLRVPRSAQSSASAFDESISTVAINTNENTAYNVQCRRKFTNL